MEPTEPKVYLRKPNTHDKFALMSAYADSATLHAKWTYPPNNFDSYIAQDHRYLVCHPQSNAILGTFNISGIVRGWFQSAYLGYEAFAPHQRQGYMFAGLQLMLHEAFNVLNLHRLEANIQSDNIASIKLVQKAGFHQEGFSPKYLRIGNKEWKDHERWAIVNEHWIDTTEQQ